MQMKSLKVALNLQAYALNPVSWIDPRGLQSVVAPIRYVLGEKILEKILIRVGVGTATGVGILATAEELTERHKAAAKVREQTGQIVQGYGGNCRPEDLDRMQSIKNEICKNYSCKGTDDYLTLHNKMLRATECAIQRENIMNRCFGGGDTGHKMQAEEARKAAAKCNRYKELTGD